jgi:hypothetical protein
MAIGACKMTRERVHVVFGQILSGLIPDDCHHFLLNKEEAMDMEHIEIQLEEAKNIQRAGFMSMQHYREHKDKVIGGFVMFGDLFTMNLGYALNEANTEDSLKILRYWNQKCEQHAIMYKSFLAIEKAEKEQTSA